MRTWGVCDLIRDDARCNTNGDCGNGQKCFKGKCRVSPEWSPCKTRDECGNGFSCIAGVCLKQYCDRRQMNYTGSPILPGNKCEHRSDCGDGQQCDTDEKLCVLLPNMSNCTISRDCGNGNMCMDGVCRFIPNMYPCDRNNECGFLQQCGSGHCRNTYGTINEHELSARAKEDHTLQSMWQDAVLDRIDHLESRFKEALIANNQSKAVGNDFVRNVKDLTAERERLAMGRKVLEKELNQRAQDFANGDDSMEGCELCKAEEDIQRLLDEVERLKEELKSCIEKPEAYIPTCQEDLNFQIDRLKEEIHRRRALLQEELKALEEEYQRLSVELRSCRDEVDGCPMDEEQSLLLRLKQIEDELYMRKKYSEGKDKMLIYKCLWTYHEKPKIKVVGELMLNSLDKGCPKLKTYDSFDDVYECMCADWEDFQKVKHEAKIRAAEAEAAKEASKNSTPREELEAQKRANEKTLAEEVAKQLLWNHMKKKDGFQELLKMLARDYPDDAKAIEAALAARQKLLDDCMNKEDCKDVDTDKEDSAPIVSPTEIDACLGPLRSGSIKANIRKSFTEGKGNNGCALLALASNALLQDVYKCLCKPRIAA